MTRCTLLDGWLNAESKKIDKSEKVSKKEFVTGKKIKV